jgi:predicted nucleic acid-binding protein
VIFVDTSFWAATISARDSHHEEAIELLRRHERARLLTSNHVIGETWTFLRRRHDHRLAVGFLDSLDQTERLEIVQATREIEAESLSWLRRHDEREYSFVDATSFAVMGWIRVREAFAFDGDFAAAGFIELRAS